LALALTSCSQGPTAPSAGGVKGATAAASADGAVRESTAGDVIVGPGAIDMNLVRVGQTAGVPAFFASPGGEYVIAPNRDTEIYVQIWNSNPPVQNPRLVIDWGNGQKDNIGCGSCRLTSRYSTDGRYTVKVTMDDRVSSTTTRTFTFRVVSGNGAFSFSNSALITINDVSPATPYPSAINVSGLAGRIDSATVTINGFSHTYPSDVDILLIGPKGQAVRLMDDASGFQDANNATITFQDGAPAYTNIPIGPGSFTFSPTSVGPGVGDLLPASAPAVYGATSLASLIGTNPNGTWQLYVADDALADIGQIAGGWSITFNIVGASSTDVVKAGSAGGAVSASSWPSNDYIMNYPYQKPDRN